MNKPQGIIAESAIEAANILLKHMLNQSYSIENLHAYTDIVGNVTHWRIRLKHETNRKEIRPMHRGDDGLYYLSEPVFANDKKPLYRLHLTSRRQLAQIWVVEGEKCVDALNNFFAKHNCFDQHIAITSGSATSDHGTDWSALYNRSIVIYPDNDEEGAKYASSVAQILVSQDCKVEVLDISALELPEKGDVVDWLEANPEASIDDLLAIPNNLHKPQPELAANDQLVVITLKDFLLHELPIRENILAPWLTTQSLNMIYAWRGVGKTHVALGIAYAIASGGDFLGWKTDKPRGVLYLDGEMPSNTLQERLAIISGSQECEIPDENFRLIARDMQTGFMPDLATAAGQEIIDTYILPSTDVIIIDNLSCLVRGDGQENEAKSWLSIGEWALSKRSQGKTLIFIHHAGKNGNQRGTSKKEDILDTVILLKQPSDYTPDKGACFEVRFEKARHTYGDDNQSFLAQLMQEDTKQRWEITPLAESNKNKVIELFKEGVKKADDIATALGIDRTTVYRNLNAAEKEGLISKPSKKNK